MTKNEIIQELERAKAAHVSWHANGQALSLGVESCKSKTPILHTECEFGKWYYSTGRLLDFTNNFSTIEPIHRKLHELYNEIYIMSDSETKKGIFSSKKNTTTKRSYELTKLVNKLKEISKSMMIRLENLENELNKMTNQQLLSKIMD